MAVLSPVQLDLLRGNKVLEETISTLGHASGDERFAYYNQQLSDIASNRKYSVYRDEDGTFKTRLSKAAQGFTSQAKMQIGGNNPWEQRFMKDLATKLTQSEIDILRQAETGVFSDGTKLCRYGDVPDCVYILLSGAVNVVGRDPSTYQPKPICDLLPGDLVGELEFTGKHPCVADVFAKGEVKVTVLGKDQLAVMEANPKVMSVLADQVDKEKYKYYRDQVEAAMVLSDSDDDENPLSPEHMQKVKASASASFDLSGPVQTGASTALGEQKKPSPRGRGRSATIKHSSQNEAQDSTRQELRDLWSNRFPPPLSVYILLGAFDYAWLLFLGPVNSLCCTAPCPLVLRLSTQAAKALWQ